MQHISLYRSPWGTGRDPGGLGEGVLTRVLGGRRAWVGFKLHLHRGPPGAGSAGRAGRDLGDQLLDAVGLRLGALFLTPDSAGDTETASR